MSAPHSGNQNMNSAQGKGDGTSDIKRIIHLVRTNWYLLVISVPLCLGAVYLFHRYTTPVYKASVTMLFKSNSERNLSDIDLMEGFGLSPEVRNIENQSFIIRSQKIIRKAIDRLDFRIAYYADGRFKDTELYHSAPFVVEMNTERPQLLNVPILFQFNENGNAVVSASADQGVLHNFEDAGNVGNIQPFTFEQEIAMGDTIEHPYFTFRLIPHTLHRGKPSGNYFVTFQSHERLTGMYRSRVAVSNYREGSSIVFISATGHNPQKTARFLNVLSEVILENNLSQKNDMATRSLEFIQLQLSSVADTLQKTQQQLMDFRRKNRFMVPSEFAARLGQDYFEREKELRLLQLKYTYYQTLKSRLLSGDMEEDYLLSAFAGDDAGVVRDLVSGYMETLAEKKMAMAASGEANPYYADLDKKLNLTRKTLLQALDKMMETVKIREEEVKDHSRTLSASMERLPALERDYLSLERAFKLNDAIYTFLLQKNSETQIAKASNIPDNEVLDEASVSGIVSPDEKGNYSKAFLLSLLIPAAFVGLRELLNNRIRDKREMEALAPGIPFLGTIVRNKHPLENVIYNIPHSLLAESFRSLRARVRFLLVENQNQVMVVTSTDTGEGKTFCALNLASVFAISGNKVALCGFDMRRPRLSEIFKRETSLGISNFLIGQATVEDVIYESELENLYFVPAGVTPPNPSELIAGNNTKTLFNHLRDRFDIVIVDTPPIGLVADARLLMQHSDCQLFIVRNGITHREHFSTTISELIAQKVDNLGLVLNDVNPSDNRYGYHNKGYYGNGSEIGIRQ